MFVNERILPFKRRNLSYPLNPIPSHADVHDTGSRRYRQNCIRSHCVYYTWYFVCGNQSAADLALAEHDEQFAGTDGCQFRADNSRPTGRTYCQHRHAAAGSRIRPRRSAARVFVDDGAVRLGCRRLVLHHVREYPRAGADGQWQPGRPVQGRRQGVKGQCAMVAAKLP